MNERARAHFFRPHARYTALFLFGPTSPVRTKVLNNDRMYETPNVLCFTQKKPEMLKDVIINLFVT